LRDYDQVLEAARQMPDREFRLVTTILNDRTDLPPNVTVGGVPFPEFLRLMQSAAAVILPIRKGLQRNAGLATLLNSMMVGKPVITNDVLGVRDYLEDKVSGLVVDGSPESYVQALEWLFDPANRAEVEQMGRTAEESVRQKFSYEKHINCLASQMRELIAEHQKS
jgi:glycosyltransferase involved in cell wall biosynthesis